MALKIWTAATMIKCLGNHTKKTLKYLEIYVFKPPLFSKQIVLYFFKKNKWFLMNMIKKNDIQKVDKYMLKKKKRRV